MAMVQLNLDALQATTSALKIAIQDMTDAAAGIRRRLDYVWLSAPGLAARTPGGSAEAELRDILADLQHRFDMGVRLLDPCPTGMDPMSAPGPHMVWLDETLVDDRDAQTVADLIAKYGQGDDPLTDVPQDLLDLLAADSDDPEFGRHLATLLDPLDAAALLATLDSIRHPYGPAVGNGVSTPSFEARLDQLVTHLGQALGAGLQTLPPDQQQQVSDRWASAFTTAPIAAPDLSLIISRGAWPDVFLTDVSDAISNAENDWPSGLSHLASNTDPPETFWMHSGATPITDPGQRLANGDFIQILDPMYGVWMAARTNPDWMAQRYLGGDVTTISYDLDGRQDLQGELPTALWSLFDTRGTDASALTAFLQAAGVSDMSASLSGDTGSILSDLQIVQGAFDLKQRQYEAESPWQKYHHQILGAIATVTGIAAMIASGGAATPLAVGLMAASTAAMVVDLGYNIAEHDTAGAIIDGIFLLPVAIGGITKLIQFTQVQITMLKAGQEVYAGGQWIALGEKDLLAVNGAGKIHLAPEAARALPGADPFAPFSADLASHVRDVQGISLDAGVFGGHNLASLEQTFRTLGLDPAIVITSKTEIYPGIYQVRYQLPDTLESGDIANPRNWEQWPYPKTVYDPDIVSDAQYLQWCAEAMSNPVEIKPGIYRGAASNGLVFRGYLENDEFITVYPQM